MSDIVLLPHLDDSGVQEGVILFKRKSDNSISLLYEFDSYHTGRDELFCLDFNQLDEKGEPKVVSFVPSINLESQRYGIIANDLVIFY